MFLDRAIALQSYESRTLRNPRIRVLPFAREGENAMVDGIEATDSDFLKAWYVAFQEDESVATLLIEDVKNSSDLTVQFTFAESALARPQRGKLQPLPKNACPCARRRYPKRSRLVLFIHVLDGRTASGN